MNFQRCFISWEHTSEVIQASKGTKTYGTPCLMKESGPGWRSKATVLQQDSLGFKSQLQQLPTVCPLSSYLTSLKVKFSHLLNTGANSTYPLTRLF